MRCTSVHWRWGAKQAMAHTLISMPVWNCLFLMSHTPWTGVAIALFCKWQDVQSEKNGKQSSLTLDLVPSPLLLVP